MTVDGAAVPEHPDPVRMRRARHAKLQAQLDAQGLDGLLLLGTSAVAYATGAAMPGTDSGRAAWLRPVAIVERGAPAPHLLTPYPEGAPDELPPDHLHPAVFPDLDDGAATLAAFMAERVGLGARLGVDELTYPMARALGGHELTPASAILGPAKLAKTPDELACIRIAQRINEQAIVDVQPMLRPGARQLDLTAAFLRRIFELGAHSNGIDPIWQVMPSTLADGPWTTHGGVGFPTPSTDRPFTEGDVVWVDTGLHHEGYASDVGRTWIVGVPRPTDRQWAQASRWRAVVDAVLDLCKPGVSTLDLARAAVAANDGVTPWIEHFYLAHGVGTDSAEMPLVGTDLGEEFDERQVLVPGMVLVLEPVIWDDGAAGYRAEDIVAITDDGWMPLSDHAHEPFGVAG